jgi:hypothetical protein
MLPYLVAHSLGGIYVLVESMGILVYNAGRRLDLRGRRILSPVMAPSVVPREGSFVLYLRPFRDDEALRTMDTHYSANQISAHGSEYSVVQSGLTLEEQLVAALRTIGPVIAVGRPGEPVPEAGAIRTYRPDDEWRDAVLDLMRRARFVFIVLGPDDGLAWELTQAVRNVPPHRLALVALDPLISREEYTRLQGLLESQLDDAGVPFPNDVIGARRKPLLPDYSNAGSFRDSSLMITFGDAGDARTSTLKLGFGDVISPSNKVFYKSFRKSLKPIADRLAQDSGSLVKKDGSAELVRRSFARISRFVLLTALPILVIFLSRSSALMLMAIFFLGGILQALIASLWQRDAKIYSAQRK